MQVKIKILSPIHIGSGVEYDKNFNFIVDDEDVYLLDEFDVVEFFVSKNMIVPDNLVYLKNFIEKHKKELIENKVYKRKIKSYWQNMNTLLENVSTQNNPIISGSSIKGAIETAIFSLLVNDNERVENIKNHLNNRRFDERRFNDRKRPHTIDEDFKKIFTYLKVSDSIENLQTQMYKTINIKKDKSHQGNREKKVEKIANYVESIKPNQEVIITMKDETDKLFREKIFQNDLAKICNAYYLSKLNTQLKYYFYKKGSIGLKTLDGKFLLNIGRFGGAENKTIDKLRYIRNSHCDNKNNTSAITFALEKNGTSPYFENELLPFGWVLCEIIKD